MNDIFSFEDTLENFLKLINENSKYSKLLNYYIVNGVSIDTIIDKIMDDDKVKIIDTKTDFNQKEINEIKMIMNYACLKEVTQKERTSGLILINEIEENKIINHNKSLNLKINIYNFLFSLNNKIIYKNKKEMPLISHIDIINFLNTLNVSYKLYQKYERFKNEAILTINEVLPNNLEIINNFIKNNKNEQLLFFTKEIENSIIYQKNLLDKLILVNNINNKLNTLKI